MNKVECGKKGEMFVMKTLFDRDWKPEFNIDSFEEVDFACKKEDTILKIQVKASPKGSHFKLSSSYNQLGYIKKTWDFVLFTNFNDIWFLPYELLKRRCGDSIRVINWFDCFKNNYDILTYSEYELWQLMIDNHITWH